ncbi:hypothetical protein [Sporosarcina highlanderae]|uniref:Uncharacterized protein n=1 Tax=Sporosarcina highlanderae TaxID=3035916 RepID=A0ABT8JVB5_9BACL|nr:hypothetical protein [Sporosarcina highlanderae]MDN4609110.1 hypothetical protein [Sporosarcina highlanderae]
MLNKLEKKILTDIYEMCINHKSPPKAIDYELIEKDNSDPKIMQMEFASYLIKLKNLGYISFQDSKVFLKGGWRNEKYKNNVIVNYTEHIVIEDKGIKLIQKDRETISGKILTEVNDIGTGVYSGVKKKLIAWIASIVFILILFLVKLVITKLL